MIREMVEKVNYGNSAADKYQWFTEVNGKGNKRKAVFSSELSMENFSDAVIFGTLMKNKDNRILR